MKFRFAARYSFAGAILLAFLLQAGIQGAGGQQPAPGVPPPSVRVSTRLVLVDVVAKDANGQHVTGLTAEDFTVLEDGKPQKVAIFSFEQPPVAAKTAENSLPPLPENVTTNRPAYLTTSGTPTILLIDALNTPARDQARARLELLRYLAKQLRPGQPIAVYTLGRSLQVLQDFTDDPRLLKAAVERFSPDDPMQLQIGDVSQRVPRSSGAAQGYRNPSPDPTNVLQRIRLFYTEEANVALDARVGMTLSAFQEIARNVAGMPGRKSLIWVSGSFPIATYSQIKDLENRSNNPSYVSVDRQYEDVLRRTASIMSDSQVAVYPVDAAGLLGSLIDQASQSGVNDSGLLKVGEAFAEDLRAKNAAVENVQTSMTMMAAETGGLVFINRNDLDNAVALSVADASAYYVLGYYPEGKNWDGKFHKIEVKVKRSGVDTRYRRGYYAAAPGENQKTTKIREGEIASAMQWNAPLATTITFDARVVSPAPSAKMKVPVEFLVDSATVSAEDTPGGKRFSLQFHVAAYALEGKLAASRNQGWRATLKPADEQTIRQQGLPFRTELELAPGRYKFRLGVVDDLTGYIGTANLWMEVGPPQK
jgi:VWFA-related protein